MNEQVKRGMYCYDYSEQRWGLTPPLFFVRK